MYTMRVSDSLTTDHVRIEEVLDAVEAAATRLERGEDVAPTLFVEAANYLMQVVNGCHQNKEERYLFPKLQEHGLAVEGGLLGAMVQQHNRAQGFVRTMHDRGVEYADGSLQDAQPLIDAARGYAAVMRDHILQEDRVLFQMADQLLGPDEQQDLFEACALIEQEVLGREERRQPFHALVEELERAGRPGKPRAQ